MRVSATVVFPEMPVSIELGVEENEPVVSEAIKSGRPVVFLFQEEEKYVPHTSKGLGRVGVLGRVVKSIKNPDDEAQILCFLGPRVAVDKFNVGRGKCTATLRYSPFRIDMDDLPLAASMQTVADRIDELFEITKYHPGVHPGAAHKQLESTPPLSFLSIMSFQLPMSAALKYEILSKDNISEMIFCLLGHVSNLVEIASFKDELNRRTQQEMTDQQREAFLQQQLNIIQDEMGNGVDNDVNEFKKRAKDKVWNEETEEHFKREIAKLERYNPNSPDYSIQYSYLDTFLALPWQSYSTNDYQFEDIEKTLDRDHFGLERVKERILEQIAVATLREDNRAPILCLVGPPGVGKTSLGKSIAEAMGREYARVSFGGMHDEAEIRGHRRTYIGAMPGRIMAALSKKKFSNPLIVLDEIDKIGRDFKGDPSTALLEVLDPEQNNKFHDNYIDADYDLSNVLFIATANYLETISAPLRDRMEIISIPGYITEEKVEIAKRHLLRKQLKAMGLEDEKIEFSDDALIYIIDYYTRESGVRKLEKTIAKVLRKIAVKKCAAGNIRSRSPRRSSANCWVR